jgi:hypothetical protein
MSASILSSLTAISADVFCDVAAVRGAGRRARGRGGGGGAASARAAGLARSARDEAIATTGRVAAKRGGE